MSSFIKILFFATLFVILPFIGFSQTTFKSFNAYAYRSGVEVNWEITENLNRTIKRISIQRSRDSLSYFSTVGSIEINQQRNNRFIDKEPFPGKNYYRLFVLFKNGSYAFSKTKKAIAIPNVPKGFNYDKFNNETPEDYFQPSLYIYTNREGNVNVQLPEIKKNNYTIRIYNASNQFLFELTNIDKNLLIIDKANFLHSGWFHYKLYKNGHIFEKWKFLIPQ